MVDIETTVFNSVYDAVTAVYTDADISTHYVNQPSSFPHVQMYEESNTTNRNGMNLTGMECFSNLVYHFEIFDNNIDGKGKETVKAILAIIDPVMRRLGFRRTYCAPVPNYDDASIYRYVVRYSKIQPN